MSSLIKQAVNSKSKIAKAVMSGNSGISGIYNPTSISTNKTEKSRVKDLEMKKHLLKSESDFSYTMNFSSDIQYNELELFIFNHKGWICGYQDNDFTSADHLLMRCAMRHPKGILLGDCNISDMEKFKLGNKKYSESPQIEKISGENLLGRQMFMDYFRINFPTNLTYIKEYGDYKMSELDQVHKRKVFNANLTLAYYGCYYEQMKLVFSSPNKLLHLEDLVLYNTLEETQYIFYLACQEYMKRAAGHEFLPAQNPPEFYTNLHRLNQEIHTEKLFDKKCQYSAAIFRKIHKIYPDNILFMPHQLVVKTYEHITDTFCPEFDEIYRNKDFKQKLREVKVDKSTLSEVIEKICILSHLVDKEFINYIMNGVNPLKIMFAGIFSHFPDEEVFKIFNKVNSMYQSELERIFFDDLKRISETYGDGRYWTRDYTDEVAKWDKHSEVAKTQEKTEFVVDKIKKIQEMNYINQLLLAQIGINIKMKEKNGQNMNIIKLQLKKYFSGLKTKHNCELYNQLLAEANAQLGLLKLPASFRKFEKHISEVIYDNLEQVLGEDPQKVYQNAIAKIYNQLRGIDPFIVKDGSEPEMKESNLKKSQVNLIEITEKFIFGNNKKNKENISKPNKSLNNNKTTLIQKIEEEMKRQLKENQNKSDINENNSEDQDNNNNYSNILDLDTIDKIQDENDKKRLETIYELKTLMEQQDAEENENEIIISNNTIDLQLFKNKSLEELKKMDIEEVASYEVETDADGHMTVKNIMQNESEVDRIEKEMTVSGKKGKLGHVDLAEAIPEKNFLKNYTNLAPQMHKKDMIRARKIEMALDNGEYYDDPVYVTLLMTDDRYVKQREKFLRKYFSSNGKKDKKEIDKLKNTKMGLLDKYANMDGDIVDNMIKDDVYYKYDSTEGKQVFNLYNQFMEELDKDEESEEVYNAEKLGTNWTMDNDHEDNSLTNIHEYLKDRMDEMKSDNKSIYYKEADNQKVKKASNSSNSGRVTFENNNEYANNKGRALKKNNKKLQLL